jgi:hypothetical protein
MGVALDVVVSLILSSPAALVEVALDVLVELFVLTASKVTNMVALDILFALLVDRLFVHACTPSAGVTTVADTSTSPL